MIETKREERTMNESKPTQSKPTQNVSKLAQNIDKPKKPANVLRDQSETEGRIGEGKNAGVRNDSSNTSRGAPHAQCSVAGDGKRADYKRNPDVRVGAKGAMQLDIGESICLQPGNQ